MNRWTVEKALLSFAVILLVLQVWTTCGSPTNRPKIENSTQVSPRNESNMITGHDMRMRSNVTNPCPFEYTVCLFFIFCEHGTIQTHENGLAFRGLETHNKCPFYDDVCCTPNMPLIQERLKQNSTKFPALLERELQRNGTKKDGAI